MKLKLFISIALALLSLGIGILYIRDSATVEQAIAVDGYLKDHCRLHNKYPNVETLQAQFPELYAAGEWYYWPNESFKAATFQYPMTLPIPSAPGRSKFSEFFPVIYSYAVRHPCEGLIQ